MRGLAEASTGPGAKGTAAGVFSRRAKRAGTNGGEAASPERVLAAIREVAESRGERPDRLLMVDYQQLAAHGPGLPPLQDVSRPSESSEDRSPAGRQLPVDADG